ncbi:MAG: hypothetical protein FJX75_08545 [Armatimonadetes bacterium]|nr:hypothetical protein [Armatimonadota bacterium]
MGLSIRSCFVLLSLIAPCCAQVLQYGDRAPDGMQTVGDPGALILFDAGQDGRWLNAVEVFGREAGGGTGDVRLYVIDWDGQLLRQVTLPSVVLQGGQDDWHKLPIPPMVVPREFGIGLVGQGSNTQYLQRDGLEIRFALREFGGWSGGGNLTLGFYEVPESHSYRWSPGTPGAGLWDKDWMVRAYVGNTADGDPEARDLIVLNNREAFFDRILSAEGDPLEVRTASHGTLPREEIASIHTHTVTSPATSTAKVLLLNGAIVEGALESMDADAVSVRDGDRVTRVARADVARIDFTTMAAVPIGPQVMPPVSDTRRAWSPEQATGPRDTLQGGDMQTAWASRTPDGQPEWLLLGYDKPVDIAEVRIWETYNPGAVTKVTAMLDDGTEVPLWEGDDPTTVTPGELLVTVEGNAQAKRVKVYIDSPTHPGWNEIDAVELVGKDGTRQWASGATASTSYADR